MDKPAAKDPKTYGSTDLMQVALGSLPALNFGTPQFEIDADTEKDLKLADLLRDSLELARTELYGCVEILKEMRARGQMDTYVWYQCENKCMEARQLIERVETVLGVAGKAKK